MLGFNSPIAFMPGKAMAHDPVQMICSMKQGGVC